MSCSKMPIINANYQYQCRRKGHSTLKHLESRILDTEKYSVSWRKKKKPTTKNHNKTNKKTHNKTNKKNPKQDTLIIANFYWNWIYS